MPSVPVGYVLELALYKEALLSAESKDGGIKYATIQIGRWALAYNPRTRDAYFIERYQLASIRSGYYVAYPLTTTLPAETMMEILTDLREHGWPSIEGV